MMHKAWKWHWRGALLFFKVICQISRSDGTENRRFFFTWIWSFQSVTPVWFTDGKEMMHKDWRSLEQSGTKPNLVAKIWPPTLVTICAWLSKLVANVSSQFHHLGDNGAAIWQLNVRSDSAFVDHLESRAGASTTRVLVLPKMINMNILKTLYSSTTRVLIFQYLYSYVQYSPQPCLSHKYVIIT